MNLSYIDKPWGSEEILEKNEQYVLKRLVMLKGRRCSLQFHNLKRETIYVLSGTLKITLGPSLDLLNETLFRSGDVITICPRYIHRMEAIEDTIYLEASTPELDDVVRLSDDYNRVI